MHQDRKKSELELITRMKKCSVFSPEGTLLSPDDKYLKNHTFSALMGQNCSILDVYISCLTKKNPLKLKAKLEGDASKNNLDEVEWIQLQDLMSESTQHLGFQKFEQGLMVDARPDTQELKQKLRWHDIAVWLLVYNLYGNDFTAVPEPEKCVYASVMKTGMDADQNRFLILTGLLYINQK